jgi:hypothetical protein
LDFILRSNHALVDQIHTVVVCRFLSVPYNRIPKRSAG